MAGLNNLHVNQENNAVKTYYDRQNQAGFVEAFGLVQGALVAGHQFKREPSAASQTLAWAFNSSIHVRALVEVGFSVWNLFDRRLFSTQNDEINEFLKLYIGMKALRTFVRVPHAALPAIQNDDILGVLFGASALRLVAGATLGSFIQKMAQIIHFRAYQETGLPRYDERRWTIIVDGRRSITSAQPADLANAPYTRLVRAIFSRDTAGGFREYTDQFVNDIIVNPAGWTAIAHRLVVL